RLDEMEPVEEVEEGRVVRDDLPSGERRERGGVAGELRIESALLEEVEERALGEAPLETVGGLSGREDGVAEHRGVHATLEVGEPLAERVGPLRSDLGEGR